MDVFEIKDSISEDELLGIMEKHNGLILDARSSSAFIGWRLEGEEREGHISGALDFSADWIRYGKEEEAYEQHIEDKLKFRGIDADKSIVVYDQSGKDAPLLIDFLNTRGIKDVRYFNLSLWRGELIKFPGYADIVPPSFVYSLINGEKTEHYMGKGYRIFEISWGEASEAFLSGHIPQSIHIDSEEFEVGPEWIRVSDKSLVEFACKYGVTVDTTVIVYGMDRLNTSAAGKLAAVFKYMGVKQVLLINGGLRAWKDRGYPLSKEIYKAEKVDDFGADILDSKDESYFIDIEEAKAIVNGQREGQLVDIRRWEHYIGEHSGYTYVPKAGRLPGSIWCYDPYMYANPDATVVSREEMQALWESKGIDCDKEMAFFCGSASWGGALIEMYARAAGFDKATCYEGGWCQWQLDDNNPYESGIPEESRSV